MLYQLPTGKVVWLEVEDVLNLSKQDLQFLIAINAGEHVHNPFKYSSVEASEKPDDIETEGEEDIETYYEEFFPDEFPDLLDDGINLEFDD